MHTSILESVHLVFFRIDGTCHIQPAWHRVQLVGWEAQVYGRGRMLHKWKLLAEVS